MLLGIVVSLFLLASAAIIALGLYGSQQLIKRRKPDTSASPADYGLAYEEVDFQSRDGIPLRGWFIAAQQPKATVIFCHGHSGSMDPDLKYVPFFHAHNYHVLMFDFRGHGRSGGAHVSMGYYERLDLLGAVDYLRRRGIDRVGVLGFSMGASVAMATAPQTEAIKAVISDGGFAELRKAVAYGIQERYRYRFLATPLSYLLIRFAGWRLGCDLAEADPIRWVSKISPRALLIIHGDQDPYTSTADAQHLYDRAEEPKEIWIVPQAGHREVDRYQPQEYREKVLEFFDRWLVDR